LLDQITNLSNQVKADSPFINTSKHQRLLELLILSIFLYNALPLKSVSFRETFILLLPFFVFDLLLTVDWTASKVFLASEMAFLFVIALFFIKVHQ
jgi:hypothetical protein